MTRCRHTRGIALAIVDEALLTQAQQRHLEGCATCRAATDSLPGLEERIRRAARSLVEEPLPAGLLAGTRKGPGVVHGRGRSGLGRIGRMSLALGTLVTTLLVATVALGGFAWLRSQSELEPGVFPSDEAVAIADLQTDGFICGAAVVGDVGPLVGSICERDAASGMAREKILLEEGRAGIERVVLNVQVLSLGMGRDDTLITLKQMVTDVGLPDAVLTTIDEMISPDGTSCSCERSVAGLWINLSGDSASGYTLAVAPD